MKKTESYQLNSVLLENVRARARRDKRTIKAVIEIAVESYLKGEPVIDS